jgi:PTS system mannose-specific IID component
MQLTRRTLWKVFLRSLLFQATWNFERMQNLGFAFAMAPALEVLYAEPAARAEACERHLELFNTHPYLAAMVLGVAVRLEEDQSSRGISTSELTFSFKVGTMGGLGAIGDAFFWASLKPFSVVFSLLWEVLVGGRSAIVVFLVLYNLVHLTFRGLAFYTGYRLGVESAARLQALNIPRLGKWVKWTTLGLLGGFAALVAREVTMGQTALQPPWTIGMLLISYGAWRCLQAGMSTSVLIYVITALAVILSYLFL